MSFASRQRQQQRRAAELARYLNTPEALSGRAQMESAHAEGIPYDLDHFPLVTPDLTLDNAPEPS